MSSRISKAQFLRYVGRYIRRPPVAQHRLERVTDQEFEYLAKDTRNLNRLSRVRFSNEQFLAILEKLASHAPGRLACSVFGWRIGRLDEGPLFTKVLAPCGSSSGASLFAQR